jgi:hypothetical protein
VDRPPFRWSQYQREIEAGTWQHQARARGGPGGGIVACTGRPAGVVGQVTCCKLIIISQDEGSQIFAWKTRTTTSPSLPARRAQVQCHPGRAARTLRPPLSSPCVPAPASTCDASGMCGLCPAAIDTRMPAGRTPFISIGLSLLFFLKASNDFWVY